jgi:hypothetical protein
MQTSTKQNKLKNLFFFKIKFNLFVTYLKVTLLYLLLGLLSINQL